MKKLISIVVLSTICIITNAQDKVVSKTIGKEN